RSSPARGRSWGTPTAMRTGTRRASRRTGRSFVSTPGRKPRRLTSRALSLSARARAEYAEAVPRAQQVMARDPVQRGAGGALLGDLHLRFGHYAEARAALEEAVKSDATIPEWQYKLAQARRLAGDPAGAARAMRR